MNAAIELQKAARYWHDQATGALWEWQAIGFSGYEWQWRRWKSYSADEVRAALAVMGVSDADQYYS